MADEQQLTLEQELEALRPESKPSPEVAAVTPPATTAPPVGSETAQPEVPLTPETPAEETLEAKLEKITETPIDEPKTPTLTDEQQKVFSLVPDVRTAENLAMMAQSHQNFTGAFERGDFDSVEQMFEQWKPETYQAFLEHIYAKRVASGEWVDRFIQDKEGSPVINKGIQALQLKINQLEQRLRGEDQSKVQQSQQEYRVKVATAYTNHLNGLFDQIEFSPADRRWVMADINAKVAGNDHVRQQINSGNTAAVNKIFKDAVKEYVSRDQATAKGREETIKAQESRKPLVQSGQSMQAGLPDDIRQVPKGQEDAWMDDQFAKLAARHKK